MRKEHPSSSAHNYSHDLLVGINHLKEKRIEAETAVEAETKVNEQLKDDIAALNERL